jgi:D-aspartate ligase
MHELTPTTSRPAAVVLGLDCVTGLQTARILARRGVPVIGVAKDKRHFCARTRACEEILTADTDSEDFLRVLDDLGERLRERAVLFPCTDLTVLNVSRHRTRLERGFHVVLPDPEVVETLIDKAAFHSLAEERGWPVPRSVVLRSRADAERAAGTLEFPCALKPALKTATWNRSEATKAFTAANGDHLLSLYDRIAAQGHTLLAQEWIPGGHEEQVTCNCYFDSLSRPVVTFVTRKLRQWPPEFGVGCLGEEYRDEVVLETTTRLFESVGFRGLAYLEMKRDERTGNSLIVEANIGRPTGRSATAEAAGVELLYAMYCDAVGLPLPPGLTQPYAGTKWIYFVSDIRAAHHQWRRKELTIRGWWRSLQGPKVDAVLSLSDPLPFVYDLRRGAGSVIGLLGERISRRRRALADARAARRAPYAS